MSGRVRHSVRADRGTDSSLRRARSDAPYPAGLCDGRELWDVTKSPCCRTREWLPSNFRSMSCADAPLTLSLSPSDGERVAFRPGEGSRWTFENQSDSRLAQIGGCCFLHRQIAQDSNLVRVLQQKPVLLHVDAPGSLWLVVLPNVLPVARINPVDPVMDGNFAIVAPGADRVEP